MSAGIERHSNSGALVVAAAPYLREVPAGPEITRAPFGVRFEATAREHDRTGAKARSHRVPLDDNAGDRAVASHKVARKGLVKNVDAGLFRRLVFEIGEADPAAHGLDHEATEPFALCADLGALPSVRQETQALSLEPHNRV